MPLEIREINEPGVEPFGIWDTEKQDWVRHSGTGNRYTRSSLDRITALLERLEGVTNGP